MSYVAETETDTESAIDMSSSDSDSSIPVSSNEERIRQHRQRHSQRLAKQKAEQETKRRELEQQREWIRQARAERQKERSEAFSSDNDSYLKRRDAVRAAKDEMEEDVKLFPMTVPVIHYKCVCESADPISGNHYGLTKREASRFCKF